MLVDIQNIIMTTLEAIKDIGGKRVFTTVDVWNDDPEEMIKKVIRLPAALVALGDGRFGERESIGRGKFQVRLGWDVFILFENVRNPADASAQGLSYIDAVVAEITDTMVDNFSLVPAGFALVATKNGKSLYGVNFELDERMGK